MLWVPLGILTAFFFSLEGLFGKRAVSKVDPMMVSFLTTTIAVILLLPLILVTGVPVIREGFWTAVAVSGGVNIFASILFFRALGLGEISLTMPMLSFTPVFLLVTSPLILGEFPRPLGVVGILLTVLGAYLLQVSKRAHGELEPFRALIRNRGTRYMLFVSLVWSVSANFDKIGTLASSPTFYTAAVFSVIAVGVFMYAVVSKKVYLKKAMENWHWIALGGAASTLTVVIQMTAVQMTYVAYVLAFKRMAAIFSVGYGHYLLREEGIGERLLGTGIMIIGAIFITLS